VTKWQLLRIKPKSNINKKISLDYLLIEGQKEKEKKVKKEEESVNWKSKKDPLNNNMWVDVQ